MYILFIVSFQSCCIYITKMVVIPEVLQSQVRWTIFYVPLLVPAVHWSCTLHTFNKINIIQLLKCEYYKQSKLEKVHSLILDQRLRNTNGYQLYITVQSGMLVCRLSLCLSKHHAMKTYWGSGGIAPCILDLGTGWRLAVSFTPRPLYPQGKSPWYPLDRLKGQTVPWLKKDPVRNQQFIRQQQMFILSSKKRVWKSKIICLFYHTAITEHICAPLEISENTQYH
jgi:hypothetical protein